jgi:hypothetical protein
MQNSVTHLVFMFAQPIFMEQKEGDTITLRRWERIDYHQEYINVFQSLKKTNKCIKIRKICATENNLSNVLDKKTSILHLSAHGFKNDVDNFHIKENP